MGKERWRKCSWGFQYFWECGCWFRWAWCWWRQLCGRRSRTEVVFRRFERRLCSVPVSTPFASVPSLSLSVPLHSSIWSPRAPRVEFFPIFSIFFPSVSYNTRHKTLTSLNALLTWKMKTRLMNKVRPGSIARVDKREDGVVRTSNVTKFLASCSSTLGLSSEDLFLRDDLIEGSFESLARVSRTIIALIEISENLPSGRPRLQGRGPYDQPSGLSRAAQSTPNLIRSVSPSSPFINRGRVRAEVPVPVPIPKTGSSPIPIVRKRWSPTTGILPPVYSSTPTIDDDTEVDVDEDGMVRSLRRSRIVRDEDDGDIANGYESGSGGRGGGQRKNRFDHRSRDNMPQTLTPPPRSPLRPKHSYDRNRQIPSPSTTVSSSQVDLSLSSTPPRDLHARRSRPVAIEARQSVASSTLSDTTTFSSLLDARRSLVSNQGTNGGRFGTTRTATTEATSYFVSDSPSFSRTEASSIVPSLNDEHHRGRKRSGGDSRVPGLQDRKPSETAGVDLTRVAEEVEGGGSGMVSRLRPREKSFSGEDGRTRARSGIRLGKGKWPDDFFPPGSPSPGRELSESPKPITPLSTTPPRRLAIVGRSNDSTESLPQFPRRPSHRSRHSIDTAPSLLPKESVFGRDASPDNRSALTSKIILPRRVSQGRNPSLLRRSSLDSEGRPVLDGPVPFPRTVSGSGDQSKQSNTTSDPTAVTGMNRSQAMEKPKLVRGRFQSEIDGSSSRRKPRPTSDDGSGQNLRRSRFESMVNLGVATNTASASDLLNRNALEDNAVRPTLIVREEGKPATQFVSIFFQSLSLPFVGLRSVPLSVCLFLHMDVAPLRLTLRPFSAPWLFFVLLTYIIPATRKLHRPRTVRSGVPGAKFKHGPDGCGQEGQLNRVERRRNLAADEGG